MTQKRKEVISGIELWAAMFIYISADAMTAPIGAPAGNQSWISIAIAICFSLCLMSICTHLSDSNSGKSFIDIGTDLMGKWGGKAIGLLYAWYSFEICSYNLKNNWQMTSTVALPNTPILVTVTVAVIFVIWIAYGGIETISRLSIIFVPVLVFFLVLGFLLLSKDFNFRNFLPITEIKWRKVLYSSLQVSSFPLTLTVLFVMVFPNLKKKGQAKIPALCAIAMAGFLVLLSDIMYLLVLGSLVPNLTYPGYTTFSYIEVADFLDRAEILFYTIFIAINVIEISISLYVTAICLAKTFRINNYRILLVPLGFLVIEQSTFIVRNHPEHISIGIYAWPWYSLIFQLVIPLFLLIFSSIKKKTKPSESTA